MNLLPLYSQQWRSLNGGYKIPYDPSKALELLAEGHDVWPELWENLHHQGDVGEASYASIPHLVEIARNSNIRSWQFYALISTIEIERHRKSNPPIPDWLKDSYANAWAAVSDLASSDLKAAIEDLLIQGALSAIAISKGRVKLGAFILFNESTEIDEILEAQIAWSELYG